MSAPPNHHLQEVLKPKRLSALSSLVFGFIFLMVDEVLLKALRSFLLL